MKLKNSEAEIFIPDGTPAYDAIRRTTHLGIGAHQDDLEIAAYHGILQCYNSNQNWFFGITVTDGSGSPRDGRYASCSNEEMVTIRNKEQKKAATRGKYAGVALLNYPGHVVRDPHKRDAQNDISEIISVSCPETIYTHNPADKHATHVAVTVTVIKALREIPPHLRPKKLYGCEVWRSLDWLDDKDKVLLDVSANPVLAVDLIKVHDSQVSGGKRYDLATQGRRMANATYADAHNTDSSSSVICAMDMTPLIEDVSMDIQEFLHQLINRFKQDVYRRLPPG